MATAMMKTFGVDVVRKTDPETGKLLDIYEIPRAVYKSPLEHNIEFDASNATYHLAIAAITGTTCTVSNIGFASLQGDGGRDVTQTSLSSFFIVVLASTSLVDLVVHP